MNIDDLIRQLRGRGGFEAVNNTATDTQIRLMGRVNKQAMPSWLIIIQCLLQRAAQAGWSVDVSKQYFLRNEQVVFGWRLIFQGGELAQHLQDITQTVMNAPRAKVVVSEQPLAGARGSRNMPGATGKGAQGVLKAAVGPKAVSQAQFLAGRTP